MDDIGKFYAVSASWQIGSPLQGKFTFDTHGDEVLVTDSDHARRQKQIAGEGSGKWSSRR